MNFADIKQFDVANGMGIRVSLFVSGCTHQCEGCFNEVAWDFNYGEVFGEEEIQRILSYLEPDYIAGLTLLGGEPFEPENQAAVLELVRRVKKRYPHKNIWCFTGYLFDQDILETMCKESLIAKELVESIDVLVDGKFVQELRNLKLKFRGSENQRLIDVKRSLEEGTVVMYQHEYGQVEDEKERQGN